MTAAVDVVIVSHDSGDDLVRSVRSAVLQQPTPGVVVVDNASHDDHPLHVAEQMGARVHRLAVNTGFAEGASRGIALSSAGIIVLLNPDAELMPGAIAAVIDAAARRPDVGLFAFAVHRRDGDIETVGHLLAPGGLNAARGPGAGAHVLEDEDEVALPSGAAMAVRRAVIHEVGAFVPGWFAYGDEADLALRARRVGWRTWAIPSARAVHTGSADTPGKAYLVERNRIWVWASHLPLACGAADSVLRLGWMGAAALRGHGALGRVGRRDLAYALVRAWRDALIGLPRMLVRRARLGGDARGAAVMATRHRLPLRRNTP